MKKPQDISLASPEYRQFIEELKVRALSARLYYLRAAAQFGWSRNVLLNQINNFPLALPEHLAEQAEKIMKSSHNQEIERVGKRLPQRGYVRQPKVAARPLPWGAICHAINPNGVASG